MTATRLSIIMPNYNHAEFLPERISTILSQLGENDELVFVDDASTDNSVAIVKKFAKQDSRIKFSQNSKNLGVNGAANVAVNNAKGEYICWLASDDDLLPGFIDETMRVLLENPTIGICCSDCAMHFIDNPNAIPGKIYTTRLLEDVLTTQIFSAKEVITIFRDTTFWIPGHTSIARRSLVLKYHGFAEPLGYLSDWFLWHSIALDAGIGYIPKSLAVWRQKDTTYSVTQREDEIVAMRCQTNIFTLLKQKPYKYLHRKFRKSGILDFYARRVVHNLWGQCQHWDFIARLAKKYILFRVDKYSKKLTTFARRCIS